MTFLLRPLQVPADFPATARLRSLGEPEPITLEQLTRWEATMAPGTDLERLLALDGAGEPVGYLELRHTPWSPAGRYHAWAVVDPTVRGQGLGSRLRATAEERARTKGATRLSSQLRDDDPASLAIAQHWGYGQRRHLFESTLDLATFDPRPYAGVVERVQAGGIRFRTMADPGMTAAKRDLYELYMRSIRDLPGYDIGDAPYDSWHQWYFENPNLPPENIIVAADGDRLIGMTMAQVRPATGVRYIEYTGVDAAYRGRQIALALKLLAMAAARRAGAPAMRTNNDSENLPMLAINRKLGYQPAPGIWELGKDLA